MDFSPVIAYMRQLAIATIGAVSCFPADAGAAQKSVLVLYATRPDARISVLGDRELPRLLERGLGERVDHYSEHLDLARFADPQYRSAVADFLRYKYSGQRFDLVIAMHEIVVDFIDSQRQTLFADTPVVFFSNTWSGRRLPNSAGIIGETNFVRSINLATRLQPAIKRVYVVVGADPRDQVHERRARPQLSTLEPGLVITYLTGLTTAELKARVSKLPNDSIIFYLLVNRDGAGDKFHPVDYLQDLSTVASVPIYSWVDSAIGHGVVGGSLKAQDKQATAVAELALRILRGAPPDSIPTTAPDHQVNQVDWRQLRRWGISESRVPEGTIVLFRDPTVWDSYKVYVLVVLALMLAQTALITSLLLQRARRRQAEELFRGSQAKLQSSHDRIRTQGARLLNAQETERARIARELHDDVSQQLALLATDLELLRRASRGDTTGLAGQAWDRTQTIARSVHDLAHRLYPVKLRLLGLVPALQSLQREMERSVIVMNLVHENVPPSLPPDVTLCVFRVVQEALQNALKYSAAREVSVSIIGSPKGLSVTIADDGIGFEVGAALGQGLGLISMVERIEALDGALQIHSAPGEGTRLVIAVPLCEADRVAAAV